MTNLRCRLFGHADWRPCDDPASADNPAYECPRCGEVRHKRRLEGERPLAWHDQQAAERRAADDTDDTRRTAWIATVALSAFLITGTLLADDMAVAMLFGLLGGILLIAVAVLHRLVGRVR